LTPLPVCVALLGCSSGTTAATPDSGAPSVEVVDSGARRSSTSTSASTSTSIAAASSTTSSGSDAGSSEAAAPPVVPDGAAPPALGGHYDPSTSTYTFAVRSANATRIVVDFFASSTGDAGKLEVVMQKTAGTSLWTATVSAANLAAAGVTSTVYYGYRAWGPNWPYVTGWTPGSNSGFQADWDGSGNTFDPNKLLIDPYTREISHDPLTLTYTDGSLYETDSHDRDRDSASQASKSIVLPDTALDTGTKPSRPLTDDVIYEVQVRGLTENDPSTTTCAGTFQAAGAKAAWLSMLGVTAIELLPPMETENDIDDLAMSTENQNYWGYSTLGFLTVDRRYACDQSPGGPTQEFAAMVKAFHAAGIKVFIDAVYNHTAEGGGDALYSWRGLDNQTYYELTTGSSSFYDVTGIGADYNVANPVAAQLVLDSLSYFTSQLGVDGFRFDEAAELGNSCTVGCYTWDSGAGGLLERIVTTLPTGTAIIAEPWASASGTYQLGNFPRGWSEWNGEYRDGIRTLENKLGVVATPMSSLQDEWSGSPSLYASRSPAASINYVVSHDGFTLRDEFACEAPDNTQGWPYGPSSGGATDETQWNQNGVAAAQEQAERNAVALMATSMGVPMITGGDELGRTIQCNDNPYDVDSIGNWLDWPGADATRTAFVAGMFATRAAHASLRASSFRTGTDHNGNGRPDVTWLAPTGTASASYLSSTSNTFLGFELDATEYGETDAAVMVGYNSNDASVSWAVPAAPSGTSWYVAADTSSGPPYVVAPGSEVAMSGATYVMSSRSVVLLVAR
jgi:glycogen operon protein